MAHWSARLNAELFWALDLSDSSGYPASLAGKIESNACFIPF